MLLLNVLLAGWCAQQVNPDRLQLQFHWRPSPLPLAMRGREIRMHDEMREATSCVVRRRNVVVHRHLCVGDAEPRGGVGGANAQI